MINPVITAGCKVTMHFALRLDSGDVVDSTFTGKPASFVLGDGNLPGGVEALLNGMEKGESNTFSLSPEQAFGQPNPQNVQKVLRQKFASEMALSEGLVVSFSDKSGAELPGVVTAFDAERVTIDFNHPLAGKNLLFQVEILEILEND
ncbi:MAG: FKBP-type peptidyl-prolyl cis-trans isomerase [Endozoicomonadaceae bacterium]|nr:FKBP-type peptidyl-prolyl cis-trans isomerase [Endozoicomonadaceae bacterium]